MLAPAVLLGIRGVQLVLSIIVMGLVAYLISNYTNPWASWSPASLNFMLFTSVWTILAVAYLALSPSRFPRAAHKFAIGAVEALTMIFWFAAFIAVAVLWGDSWPHGNHYHHNTFYNCGVVAIIFGAFLWISFVITTLVSALHMRDSSNHNNAPPPEMQGV